MLAMVKKFLEWLKEQKDELQDIDYANDVDLTVQYNTFTEQILYSFGLSGIHGVKIE